MPSRTLKVTGAPVTVRRSKRLVGGSNSEDSSSSREPSEEFPTSEESDEENVNPLVDSCAEEGEEDTPSDDSNDIPVNGEDINTTESELSDNGSYEDDSFLDDDGDHDLLPGDEYDLSLSEDSPKKRKSRIIELSSDSNEDIVPLEKFRRKKPAGKRKSRIIKNIDSSDEDAAPVEAKHECENEDKAGESDKSASQLETPRETPKIIIHSEIILTQKDLILDLNKSEPLQTQDIEDDKRKIIEVLNTSGSCSTPTAKAPGKQANNRINSAYNVDNSLLKGKQSSKNKSEVNNSKTGIAMLDTEKQEPQKRKRKRKRKSKKNSEVNSKRMKPSNIDSVVLTDKNTEEQPIFHFNSEVYARLESQRTHKKKKQKANGNMKTIQNGNAETNKNSNNVLKNMKIHKKDFKTLMRYDPKRVNRGF